MEMAAEAGAAPGGTREATGEHAGTDPQRRSHRTHRAGTGSADARGANTDPPLTPPNAAPSPAPPSQDLPVFQIH